MERTTMSNNTQAAPLFRTYPLKALFALPSNVRKTRRTPQAIRSMAQSIAAHGGLLQNLVVVPELKHGQPTGRAGVAAGETRRQALCLLRDGGLPDVEGYTDDYPVAVLEVSDEEAVAASASENILRTAMHPADQFKAFHELHEQCGDVEQVANFFGVTPLMVRQRLKLANDSPRLFQEYRDDAMTLEQLMALCITDDHAAQDKVWNGSRNSPWDRAPERLRQALTESELDTRSPLVQLVGLKAYEKEGGRIRRDLFAEDDAGFVIDVDMLKRLAEAKLNKAAEAVRQEGWGWVEVRTAPFVYAYHYGLAAMGRRPLSDEEQSLVIGLEAAIAADDAALDALYDADEEPDGDDPKLTELSKRLDAARAKLRGLEAGFAVWTPEVLAVAGVIIAPERNGKISIERALVRPEDRKAAAKAARPAKVGAETGSDAGAQAAPPKSAESEALTRRLTAHRTVALQRVLADNTQVALAALAHPAAAPDAGARSRDVGARHSRQGLRGPAGRRHRVERAVEPCLGRVEGLARAVGRAHPG